MDMTGWLFTLGGLDQKARDYGGLDRASTGRDLTRPDRDLTVIGPWPDRTETASVNRALDTRNPYNLTFTKQLVI
jgi:hypothetical protein